MNRNKLCSRLFFLLLFLVASLVYLSEPESTAAKTISTDYKVRKSPYALTYLQNKKGGQNKTYLIDRTGNVYHYGQLLAWSEVDPLLPRKSIFRIIDLETGLSFKAQRRAGSSHADVQPLTYADTKIMKEIYGGNWSWDRRAVVVQTDTHLLAGSMNGMPHGGGALRNGFPGHFCLHFYESTTHRSKNIDPAHQLMVQKAAGKIESYLASLSPYQLIDAYIIALHQHDQQLLKMVLSNERYIQLNEKKENLHHIERICRVEPFQEEELSPFMEVPVRISYKQKGVAEQKITVHIRVNYDFFSHSWFIDDDSLFE